MNDGNATELAMLLNGFVEGHDTSMETANQLEVLLAEAFPDDEVVQERAGDLAQYRPGGGEFLLDEKEMRVRLRRLRDYLAR